MVAAAHGHSSIVRIILNRKADVSRANDCGVAALHLSAGQQGHLAVTKLLVKAGADLEAKIGAKGGTPLHCAVFSGNMEVVHVLIEAGANPDGRGFDGYMTPLFMAASRGCVGYLAWVRSRCSCMRKRTRCGRLRIDRTTKSRTLVPLDTTAYNGHCRVVEELIQEHGIEGCGGASRGLDALRFAASMQHVGVMEILTSAGVVDTGIALMEAAESGSEASVKFLLRQEGWTTVDDGAHLTARACRGRTALLHAVGLAGESSPSPRIVLLLMEVGADTTSIVRLLHGGGMVVFNNATLAYATTVLRG